MLRLLSGGGEGTLWAMRELVRSWTESIETLVLEVIEGHRKSNRAAFVRVGLFGLSLVFKTAVKIRRFLYNVRILRDSTLGVQVIAIGNLTVGGTGKTPVVEKFARELQDEGRKVAILSRGYRSKPAPLHRRAPGRQHHGPVAFPERHDASSGGLGWTVLALGLRDVRG